MHEPFSERGVWKFRNLPGYEFPGSVSWDQATGAVLLISVRDLEAYKFISALIGLKCDVYGRLRTMPYLTFEGAMVREVSGPPSDAEIKLCAPRILKGGRELGSLGDLEIREINSEFTGLNQWSDNKSLRVTADGNCIQSESPKYLESLFHSDDKFNVYISQSSQTSRSGFKFSVRSVTRFEIKSQVPFPFKDGLRMLREIKAFLTFSLDRPVTHLTVTAASRNSSGGLTGTFDYFERTNKTAIELSRADFDEQTMVFPMNPVEQSGNAFGAFLRLYRKHITTFDFYFAQMYGSESYLYQQFCDVIFGLEGLHRALHNGIYMDKREYKLKVLCMMKHSIPGWIPDTLKSIISTRLDGANSYSLRSRLAELALRHNDYAGEYLGSPDVFARNVATMRNDIAHADKELQKDESAQLRLLGMLHGVRLLFQLELMLQLGFTPDFIKTKISSLKSARLCRMYHVA